ncbi:MAG: hypothetical protein ABI624_01290 [Casimicrobiaceae bacterium]
MTRTDREVRGMALPAPERKAESAISWGAILAGAAAAAALSLILLALGAGLGLSSISPWAYEGASATTLGVATIAWLLLMSGIASAVGGYIAGRLRSLWSDAHADEAFFRDTAHGFLAWAAATIVSAALLTTAATSMVGAAARAGAVAGTAVAGAAAAAGTAAAPNTPGGSYFVDMLFRTDRQPVPGADMDATRTETGRILANALRQGDLAQGDKAYLAQLVARQTGLSPADADQRVTQVATAAKLAAEAAEAKAREIAEAARRASAHLALWIFVSLLLGAFCGAYFATIGGRLRDGRSYTRAAA